MALRTIKAFLNFSGGMNMFEYIHRILLVRSNFTKFWSSTKKISPVFKLAINEDKRSSDAFNCSSGLF